MSRVSEAIPQRDALELQLMMIAANEPAGGLLEARWRRPEGGMGQLWHTCDRPNAIVETIQGLGQRTDVYIGGAPRRHRHGGIDAIERVWALWADLDTVEAIEACKRFAPPPSVVVHSGTGRHAWWPLLEPLAPPHARIALRRLAHTLGADMASAEPARILRPAGTFNHKTSPPRPVVCERLEFDSFRARDVVGDLPDPPAPLPDPPPPDRAGRPAGGDPLKTIAAAEYVPVLTGQPLGRDRKARCPFHGNGEERTPSLHVYDLTWACYACPPLSPGADRLGGDIYVLAGLLWRLDWRDPRQFVELRQRLATELLSATRVAA